MEDISFNYIDNLQSSANLQLMSNQNDKAIQMTGRKAYIFLLDKEETELSDVYKEEKHGRIYLPHYTQRALYKTNQFVSQLTAQNFTESENNLEMEFNFERMVYNINSLKEKENGKLLIKNVSNVPLEIEIFENKFIVKKYRQIIYQKEFCDSIYKFIGEFKKDFSLIEFKYIGDNDQMIFLDRIDLKLLPRRQVEIDLNNSIYRNISDVISHGAVIVTDRYRVYQVVGAYPKNDSYGNYLTWNVQLELFNLAKFDSSPNDFVELVKKNQYGLPKIKID